MIKNTSQLSLSSFIERLQKFKKIEYLYAFTALFFGFIFILIVPPGWNPDEPQHYWRAQQIAHGQILSNTFDGPNDIIYTGGPLLPDEAYFILSYKAYDGITDYSLRLNFPMWKNDGVLKHAATQVELVDVAFPGSAHYSPLAYAPQAAGLWIANHLNLPLLVGFFLAKTLGLILQVTALFFAIRLIPRGKWILLIIGLLPITVAQSVSFGGDVITNSVAILFIAATLKIAYDTKKVTRWHIASLAALVGSLGLVKPSYLPLALLVLIIPMLQKKFRTIPSLLKHAGIFILVSIPGLLWLKITSSIQDNYSHGVDAVAQKHYVLQQPLDFISALFNTYFTDAQPKLYKTLLGNFVWDTAPLPLVFMFIAVILIVLSIFLSSPREKNTTITPIVKTLFLGISVLLIALISYALYIYYTPLKGTSILGIQSRYFIPFLPLILLALHNPMSQTKQKGTKLVVILLLLASLVATITVLMGRIYT